MYKLEGINNLETVIFIKKNIIIINIIALLLFSIGFVIGYIFYPAENIISVKGETIDENKVTIQQDYPK